MIKSKKILVIDDEADIRAGLHLLLAQRGYEVIECGNGLHALQKLRAGVVPDLIICDVSMPGEIKGIQVLEFVREQKALKATPFIILTGHSERQTVISAGAAGVTCFMLKPFKSGDLLKKVETLIIESSAASSENDSTSNSTSEPDSN